MKIQNINTSFLDKVLKGSEYDYWYHLGIGNDEPFLADMTDLKAVIVAGSGARIERMVNKWCELKNIPLSDIIKFPKEERFTIRYAGNVLFCSHGMGMPSASIAIQELMKLVYFVKKGNTAEMDRVFWCRVGTSGGLTEPGNVIISTHGIQSDFGPYRLFSLGKEVAFESEFPENIIDDIINANKGSQINFIKGKTIGCNSFYIEQNRIDGGISLCSEKQKLEWLEKAYEINVRNIEMEAPMIAGFLNYWGFSRFAVICCALVNRMKGDQVTATPEELEQYSVNAENVLWNYLKSWV
jgi:uridine phosphorylase